MKDKIKANMSNSLIKDFLNQYALLWQGCDLEASKKWIKDDKLYNNFVQSYKAFQNFMGEIKAMPNRQEDLALNNLDDHSPRFGHEVYGKSSFNGTGTISHSPSQKSLYSRTGAGIHTKTERPTFLQQMIKSAINDNSNDVHNFAKKYGAGIHTKTERPKTAQPKTFLGDLMEKEKAEREKERA